MNCIPMLKEEEKRRGVGLLEVLKGDEKVMLPLAAVRIEAKVADRVATVTVAETFRNPFTEALEAVYIFPMAGGCAVSAFEMKVGDRVIVGKVKERGEARQTYQKAVQEGKRAALLEQERDDVFTVTVGNLPPGEEVSVTMTYSERLPYYDEGSTELRLPTVVAPRYIPGVAQNGAPAGDGVESDTDQVPDASRITPPRLAEGFDPKVALAIAVELLHGDGDAELADLACSQHAVKTGLGADRVKIALALDHEPLDCDFVLRWRLADKSLRKTCLAFRDGKDVFAMLSLVPPRRDGFLGLARDVVFVLDHSGSMGGVKMTSAARACSILLHTLGPRDRFAIQAFDDSVTWMRRGGAESQFVIADEGGIEQGDRFLRTIEANGGTELLPAVAEATAAISKRQQTAGRMPVVVLLTDGEVGNESQILKQIQSGLGDARVFTVGIDTAVNDGFLKRLAGLGGGTASFVVPGEKLEDALRAVGREIGAPLVTDLQVDGIEKGSLSPGRMPDLFAGRAATAFFRIADVKPLTVRGKYADGKSYNETVVVREIPMPAIAQLWARTRVADLEDKLRLEPALQGDLQAEIVKLAVRHTLLTRFTAFVVVDESEVVNKTGQQRHVVQPVAMPAKWEMENQKQQPPTGVFACSIAAPASQPECFDDLSVASEAPREMECQETASDEPRLTTDALKMDATPRDAKPSKGRTTFNLSRSKQPAPPPPPPVPKPANVRPEAGKRSRGAEGFDAAELSAVSQALEAFCEAVERMKSELDAGRLPAAAALEQARTELLKTLGNSLIGSELASLQRLLRSRCVELLAALQVPGATARLVLPIAEALQKELSEAMKEAKPLLTMTKKSGWKFWEKFV